MSRSDRWSLVALLGMLAACGSRVEKIGESNGQCREDCEESREPAACGSGETGVCTDARSGSSAHTEDSGSNGALSPEAGSWIGPPGTDETTSSNPEPVCRVAYVDYPVGAKIPMDGCGSTTCTCDSSGELVDCTVLPQECSFNGPMRPCSEHVLDESAFNRPLSDEVVIRDGYILGNTLLVEVSHSGGCAMHHYAACFDPVPEAEQRYHVRVIRDANGDSCERAIEATLRFDLTPLGQASMDRLGAKGGIITTEYGVYTFGELTCARREEAARIAVTSLLNGIDRTCTRDEECVSTRLTEDCTEECNAVSRVDQVYRFDRLGETLAAGACAGYLDDGCVQEFPLCERRTAVCSDGKCELAAE